MKLECKISHERWSNTTGRVHFMAEIGGELKQGYVTNEAIQKLEAARNTDWAIAFDQVRAHIAKKAHAKWRANPENPVIVLGAGDM